MKQVAKLSFKNSKSSFSTLSRLVDRIKKEYEVEEVYLWPEIYVRYDFSKMNPDDVRETPVLREPILAIGIK